jgi:hypothetical protein
MVLISDRASINTQKACFPENFQRVYHYEALFLKNPQKTCSPENPALGRNIGLNRTRTDAILNKFYKKMIL